MKVKDLRSPTNIFVVNLVFSDLWIWYWLNSWCFSSIPLLRRSLTLWTILICTNSAPARDPYLDLEVSLLWQLSLKTVTTLFLGVWTAHGTRIITERALISFCWTQYRLEDSTIYRIMSFHSKKWTMLLGGHIYYWTTMRRYRSIELIRFCSPWIVDSRHVEWSSSWVWSTSGFWCSCQYLINLS